MNFSGKFNQMDKFRSMQEIIIIGAPRSGTNMLRDAICSLPDFGTWPCDEINYIWRHGNMSFQSDCLTADKASPQVASYIKSKFVTLSKENELKYVVEKTCANSLRIPFVSRVLPEAKYIFIYRNGVDAVASARLRWAAKLDLRYLVKKAKFVPYSDFPYYGFKYVWNRIYRIFSGRERLAFWGPKLENMDELLKNYSLEEVCAMQWRNCVTFAQRDLARLGLPVVSVKYEEFVLAPEKELLRICTELGIQVEEHNLSKAVAGIKVQSVGKGHRELGEEILKKLHPLLSDTLVQLGYDAV